jgi:conjugative relaxase-like TrwC/TraI family protein
VLSIGKLGQGQENYYLESVALGIEDYYTGAGEAPGRWTGSAARELGLQGEVDGDGLQAALAGSNPATAAPLAAQRGGSRVPGFDLTFRPPKSVSVLFGLAGSEISSEVRDAHEAAVESALDYMERHAAVGRRGHGGIESVPGNGFLAAAFRHRTSRAGDPQLHTHVLVANITRGPDERWTALDGRKLYAHAKTGGYLYQAALRRELVRRLGLEWGPRTTARPRSSGFRSRCCVRSVAAVPRSSARWPSAASTRSGPPRSPRSTPARQRTTA